MNIAVLKERRKGERRVALVPGIVSRLVKAGMGVVIESGAGEGAFFDDQSYIDAGAKVLSSLKEILSEADIVLIVQPSEDEPEYLYSIGEGRILIGLLNPFGNVELVKRLAEKKITAFAMELIPRISRAQSMDALSSQAAVAGYRSVIIAAGALSKFFPMLTTAAGTIAPAKVFVIGAGVAGLQAIATARRLGAIVEAFDIRPAVKEEVQSLGARFVEVEQIEDTTAEGGYAKEVSEEFKKREHEVIHDHVAGSDIVITTAQVPGKKAPLLVTKEMVEAMKPGSVVVDLAAEQGGNCELTKSGEAIEHGGVKIIGPVNLPSTLSIHASQMYSKNLSTIVEYIVKDGEISLDFDDEIIKSACITHEGKVINERLMEIVKG